MRLQLLVQPRSSKNAVVGWQEERLKVSLSAAPVDGEANDALLAFLAKAWGLKKRQLSIHSGSSSRRKTLQLDGVDEKAFAAALPRR